MGTITKTLQPKDKTYMLYAVGKKMPSFIFSSYVNALAEAQRISLKEKVQVHVYQSELSVEFIDERKMITDGMYLFVFKTKDEQYMKRICEIKVTKKNILHIDLKIHQFGTQIITLADNSTIDVLMHSCNLYLKFPFQDCVLVKIKKLY